MGYFFVAFPEAAVDFRMSRSAALTRARNFLIAQSDELEGCQSSIVFDVGDAAKTFLERELGLQEANRLMASRVSLWHWRVRSFQPGQKEEFGGEVARVVASGSSTPGATGTDSSGGGAWTAARR